MVIFSLFLFFCTLIDVDLYEILRDKIKKKYLHVLTFNKQVKRGESLLICILYMYMYIFFCLFAFSRAAPTYGGSQARGLIRAAAADLRHSHSNARSEPHLRSTPQLMAMPDL